MTDEAGSVVYSSDYQPFGSSLHKQGEERYTYTGKEQDASTGLYYYGARYYDASLGRFISVDPVQGSLYSGQRLSRYTYVLNNPMVYVDPNGMDGEDPYFNPYKLHRGGGIGLLAGGSQILAGIESTAAAAGVVAIGGGALVTSVLANPVATTQLVGGIAEGVVGASPGALVPVGGFAASRSRIGEALRASFSKAEPFEQFILAKGTQEREAFLGLLRSYGGGKKGLANAMMDLSDLSGGREVGLSRMEGNAILTRGDYSSTLGNRAHTHPGGISWPSDTDIENAMNRGGIEGKFTIRTIVRTEQGGAQLHMYQPKTIDDLVGLYQQGDEAVRDSEEEMYRMILGEDPP